MRLESIDRVKENDILGKNILTNDGRILLREGMKLKRVYIDKIKEMGVFYIYLEDERLKDVEAQDERFNRLKQETMNSMSRIMKNTLLCSDKDKMTQSLRSVEKLINYIIEDGDVNKSLYDIQTYSNRLYIHSLDVCIMSVFLGKAMKIKESDLIELGIAAILHDIGELLLPKSITEKTTPFTEEEKAQFKEHTYLGAKLLKKNIRIPDSVVKAVLQHHEKVDGTGYPYGLKDKGICKFAKIIAVSDLYDYVTNSKSYNKTFAPNEAYELILGGSETMFDKDVVQAFRNTFSVYPLGCRVKLSNSIEGYVVRQNENFPDRPVIRIFRGEDLEQYYEVDLVKFTNIVITNIV